MPVTIEIFSPKWNEVWGVGLFCFVYFPPPQVIKLEPPTMPGFGYDKGRWNLFKATLLTTFSLISVEFLRKFLLNCGEKTVTIWIISHFYMYVPTLSTLLQVYFWQRSKQRLFALYATTHISFQFKLATLVQM